MEARLEKLLDRVWRNFRPVEAAYWSGKLTRLEYAEKTFNICNIFHKELTKAGLSSDRDMEDSIWACALRVVAVTFSELPKLADPAIGYNSEGEYRIVKSSKCPKQKCLVRELAALLMYGDI